MSLTVFFIVLSISLGMILVSLWFIRRQLNANKIRSARIQAGEERYLEERQKRIDSINVLLKVANTEEMGWVEASIRIKHLLDQLGLDLSAHEDISAFYLVTEDTAHIPTHEQWETLPKEARKKYRKEMQDCEERYGEHLLRGKNSLSLYDFS
ncbi:DUF2489 domain-containing protein [Marinomonas sp. C2222]|uniref:DUF2489 domain-containing protein n=1 Tax=Marinomonas sargassi TaxID=2984494 RepID=A0ABT2YV64_9GAMM|nr:DUF2489 domain-containing protein [Marinomonas sargassi]MCV2403469.1 DUF2489 domain-containing protein [Marinomonas sargassi]